MLSSFPLASKEFYMAKHPVLITGVYGLVGGAIYKRLINSDNRYDVYGLSRRNKASDRVADHERIAVPEEKFFQSDLSDLDVLVDAFKGVETVVHMAANPSGDADWESLEKVNIVGCHNVFEAAHKAGVKRIVYASTIQVSSGYLRFQEPYRSIRNGDGERLIDEIPAVTVDQPSWPINLYAATKVFAESLGRVYSSYENGPSCIGIRIGWVASGDELPSKNSSHLFCSQGDIAKLVECCIKAPDTVRCEIFYGMSRNRYLWTDIENARKIVGYVPDDDDSRFHQSS